MVQQAPQELQQLLCFGSSVQEDVWQLQWSGSSVQEDVRHLKCSGSQVQKSLYKVQDIVQQLNQSIGVVQHDLYQVQAKLRAEIQEVAQSEHEEWLHRTEIRQEQVAIRSSLGDLETDLQAQKARVQTHLGGVSSYGESQRSPSTIPGLASKHITYQLSTGLQTNI